jgi:hypothetical protein
MLLSEPAVNRHDAQRIHLWIIHLHVRYGYVMTYDVSI